MKKEFDYGTSESTPEPMSYRASPDRIWLTRRTLLSGSAALAGAVGLGSGRAIAASTAPAVTVPKPLESLLEPDRIANVRAVITDSYGTVFDIKTALITALRPHVPKPKDFATMWLSQVGIWTQTTAAMGPHAYFEFWDLVTRAGIWTARERNVEIPEDVWPEIMQAWWTPQPFDDAEIFFNLLDEAGIPTAILSNGSPEMLHAAADAAGWLPELETIISVDQAHTFKSSPQAYLLAHDVLEVPGKGDLLFVSGHQWDVAGAGAAGLRTVYLDRDNQPMWYLKDNYVDYVYNGLVELARAVLRGRDVTGKG